MTSKEIKIAYREYGNMDQLEPLDRELAQAASDALSGSYAPYSQFNVGAAVRLEDGEIVKGANQENAAYPSGLCAERTAFFKAVSEGEREFVAIAVAGGGEKVEDICPPCGVCLQVMAEFCDPESFRVYLVKNENESKLVTLGELLPYGFSKSNLEK